MILNPGLKRLRILVSDEQCYTLFHLVYFSKAFQVDYLILQDLMWDLNVLLSFLSSRDYNIPYKEKHHWLC